MSHTTEELIEQLRRPTECFMCPDALVKIEQQQKEIEHLEGIIKHFKWCDNAHKVMHKELTATITKMQPAFDAMAGIDDPAEWRRKLNQAREIIKGQMYPSHVKDGEGCEDDSCMGMGCSYCNTNEELGKALDLFPKESSQS